MSRRTGPTLATVLVVWERDEGSCLRCGTGLHFEGRGWSWSVHHRCPRGMGGSRVAWVNEAANLVLLCGSGVTGCHGWVESHRDEAEELGWLVSRHGVLRSVDVPVTDLAGRRWWLDDSGIRHENEPQAY